MYPLIVKNFLSKEIIDKTYSWTISNIHLFDTLSNTDYWKGRSLGYDLMSREIQVIIKDAFTRALKLLPEGEILITEFLHITRWPQGYELHPHADAEEPSGKLHQYWWRKFGAIIYLNNNFIGGELYYPKLNIIIKPEPGMLVIHPGNLLFLHGVKPVIGNTRFTLTSFFKNP